MNGDTTNGHAPQPTDDMKFFDQKAAEIRAGITSPPALTVDELVALRTENKRLEERLATLAEDAGREAKSQADNARIQGRAEVLRSLGLAKVAADSIDLQKPDELLALIAAHNKGIDLGNSTTGPLQALDKGLQQAADEQAARLKKSEADAAQLRSELQVERAASRGDYGAHVQYATSLLADAGKPASKDGLPSAFHSLVDAIERARAPKHAVQPSSSGRLMAQEIHGRLGSAKNAMDARDSELEKAREELKTARDEIATQNARIDASQERSKLAIEAKERERADLENKYQLVLKELPILSLISASHALPKDATAPELAKVAEKLEKQAIGIRDQREIIEELLTGYIRPKLPGFYEPIAVYIRAATEYEAKKKEYAEVQEKLTEARKGGLKVPQLQVRIIDLEAAVTAKTKEYEAAKRALATSEKELVLRTNRGKISVDYARAGIEHVRAKDYSSAITDFEKALTTNQGDPRIAIAALEGLAGIAADFGDKDTAQAYAGLLVHLVGRVPGREIIEHEMLAKIYGKLGDSRAEYHKQEAAKLSR